MPERLSCVTYRYRNKKLVCPVSNCIHFIYSICCYGNLVLQLTSVLNRHNSASYVIHNNFSEENLLQE